MQLPFFIARRYFLSKKSQRAINIISMISVLGVMVGTAALVIVLSVFNGFEDLILQLYNAFDPDIKIEAAQGKTFSYRQFPETELRKDPSIAYLQPVIEENALVRYGDKQFIVTVKGVDAQFAEMSVVDSMMLDGRFLLQEGDTDYAVPGSGVAYGLQLNLNDFLDPLEFYAPRRAAGSLLNPEEAFNRRYLFASGIFGIQQEYDSRYVLVPFRFAQDIFEFDSLVSAVEITLKPGSDVEETITRISAITGSSYIVKDRFRQHESIYRIMKSEKWAVFLILSFILIIATFNIIGTLSMLVIEKKKDIAILHSMGADQQMLQRIFLAEGVFINLIGCSIGMVIGLLICFGQHYFGWIELSGSGSFVIDAYPVKVEGMDLLFVFLTVFSIGLMAAWYPSRRMVAQSLDLRTVTNDE